MKPELTAHLAKVEPSAARRRRRVKPIIPKPRSIIAHVPGSGTAENGVGVGGGGGGGGGGGPPPPPPGPPPPPPGPPPPGKKMPPPGKGMKTAGPDIGSSAKVGSASATGRTGGAAAGSNTSAAGAGSAGAASGDVRSARTLEYLCFVLVSCAAVRSPGERWASRSAMLCALTAAAAARSTPLKPAMETASAAANRRAPALKRIRR